MGKHIKLLSARTTLDAKDIISQKAAILSGLRNLLCEHGLEPKGKGDCAT